ncbi:hypothetical protein DID75_00245 [Candidatus Marinamargulisbacteria bacterium SCGC AG-410-N11]|nr:hypothetical protein DID75_00245 [Candidatus Marinamargulisbacteria bacterium SCGC AG-410-N11]
MTLICKPKLNKRLFTLFFCFCLLFLGYMFYCLNQQNTHQQRLADTFHKTMRLSPKLKSISSNKTFLIKVKDLTFQTVSPLHYQFTIPHQDTAVFFDILMDALHSAELAIKSVELDITNLNCHVVFQRTPYLL